MVVDLNAGGLTDQDIKVIPYARIDVNNAVFENKKLKVSYTITRSKDDYKIENAFLAWHISPYIDKMSGNSEELVTVDYTNVSDKDILNTVCNKSAPLFCHFPALQSSMSHRNNLLCPYCTLSDIPCHRQYKT